jgi:hypothetical protein
VNEIENMEIDQEWFTKNKIKQVLRRSEAQHRREMLEIERLLRDYLVAMLDLTHRRLIDGRISLSQYYRDTQMLAYCGERVNRVCEEEI